MPRHEDSYAKETVAVTSMILGEAGINEKRGGWRASDRAAAWAAEVGSGKTGAPAGVPCNAVSEQQPSLVQENSFAAPTWACNRLNILKTFG
jgi:hypothetical protein